MWCVGELDDEYIEKMEDVLSRLRTTVFCGPDPVSLPRRKARFTARRRSTCPPYVFPATASGRDNEYKR